MFLTTRNFSRESATGLSPLSDRIQRLLTETLGGADWQYRDSAAASWVPAVDVFEEGDNIRITAEIPGVKPEDIKISLEGNLLTLHGTKQQEAEERTERVHRYERMYGAFERTFTLPASVDPQQIKASYDNGVLTVVLPKSEKAKPRQIEIAVGSGSQARQVGEGSRKQGSQASEGNQGGQWSPQQERSTSRQSEKEKTSR
ncbi:MAG TPA: Hsp20/alpha crystallin family protein [Gemmatimonadales bacterium]|nr:Hsp20/alpha crystallin family protein [Gemmatimonadales bacterium]